MNRGKIGAEVSIKERRNSLSQKTGGTFRRVPTISRGSWALEGLCGWEASVSEVDRARKV